MNNGNLFLITHEIGEANKEIKLNALDYPKKLRAAGLLSLAVPIFWFCNIGPVTALNILTLSEISTSTTITTHNFFK